MERRGFLGRWVAGLSAAGVAGLAGCPTEEGTPTGEPATPTGASGRPATTTVSERGTVTENTVSGIEVVGVNGSAADGEYRVTVTLRNTGEQTASYFEYDYRIRVYGADGSDMTGSGYATYGAGGELKPGETGNLTVTTTVDGNASAVDSYELRVTCDGSGVAYC